MVNNGPPERIRSITYEPARSAPAGLGVLNFEQLRTMRTGRQPAEAIRADFHVLAAGVSGPGSLTVDFVRYSFGAGDVAWIRPGWTHRWDDIAVVRGLVVLFRPDSLPARARAVDPPGMAGSPLSSANTLITGALEHLRREYAAVPGEPTSDDATVLRNLLEVLMLRVRAAAPPRAARYDIFETFAHTVEDNHRSSRELSWYADKLGYSARTLSRATHAALGTGAKRFIDDRVVLEAKRLLAHTDTTVAECARTLGFDDTANFTKFFRAHVGTAPGRFRTSLSRRET
jgi:AraC-like DNA-binding protein